MTNTAQLLATAWAGRETDTNWERMETSVRALGACTDTAFLAAQLRGPPLDALCAAMSSERSRLALAALEATVNIIKILGLDASHVIGEVLPVLLKQCERSSRLIADRARASLVAVLGACPVPLAVTTRCIDNVFATSGSRSQRHAAAEGLCTLLGSLADIGPEDPLVVSNGAAAIFSRCVASALTDATEAVRVSGRAAFKLLSTRLPDTAATLFEALPPATQRALNREQCIAVSAQPASISVTPVKLCPPRPLITMPLKEAPVPNRPSLIQATKPVHHDAAIHAFVESVKSNDDAVRADALCQFTSVLTDANVKASLSRRLLSSERLSSRCLDIAVAGLADSSSNVSSAMQSYVAALLAALPRVSLTHYDADAFVSRILRRLARRTADLPAVSIAVNVCVWYNTDAPCPDGLLVALEHVASVDSAFAAAVTNALVTERMTFGCDDTKKMHDCPLRVAARIVLPASAEAANAMLARCVHSAPDHVALDDEMGLICSHAASLSTSGSGSVYGGDGELNIAADTFASPEILTIGGSVAPAA